MKLLRLELTNFLSYRKAVLELDGLVALVGANAAGKSNAVAALKLLHDIPVYGLPTAVARRGGFDQLRHRSGGRPYDPAITLVFKLKDDLPESRYELKFGAVAGKQYEVKSEVTEVHFRNEVRDEWVRVSQSRGRIHIDQSRIDDSQTVNPPPEDFRLPEGQSLVSNIAIAYGAFLTWQLLQEIRIVEINPAKVAELQEPSSTRDFEPDGSNTASLFEHLTPAEKSNIVDELSAIVPGIVRIEPRRFSDKLTLAFFQRSKGRNREFLAKQMSDGTLRAFGTLLALGSTEPPLLVIEEPEIAIHLGALRTLVDILEQHADHTQIILTTHSADILDALDIHRVRVVWTEDDASCISRVASHTLEPVRQGLITPGELLRTDALDPAI